MRLAYIALLIPYSVMRLLVISGFSIAWEAMVFAFVCWFLLGELKFSSPIIRSS